jgi:tetratricopeptide (TPR) repeat protein
MALESQGKRLEAMAEFRIAVELAPGFIEARHALGKAAMEIKDWETAAAQFRGVIAWETKDAAAHHQLSRALRALGQTEEAEGELRAAQQLNPSLKAP